MDGGRIGMLEVRAASVRGRLHRSPVDSSNPKPRQDDYAFAASEDKQYLVVAVCDGMSWASRSHYGASIAARRACEVIVELLASGEKPAWVDFSEVAARTAGYLVAQATKDSTSREAARDLRGSGQHVEQAVAILGTTAIVGVISVRADETGRWPFVIANLAGDSSAWKLSSQDWLPFGELKNAHTEIASNAVIPLPFRPPTVVTRGVLEELTSLHLMTDGVGDPLGDGTGEVGTALRALWQDAPGLHEYARQLDFQHVGAMDDRTAVGIWPVP